MTEEGREELLKARQKGKLSDSEITDCLSS